MILTTRVYTQGTRIDYDYNPGTGVHGVYFPGSIHHSARGDAVDVIAALDPFTDNVDVRELIAWLSPQV